MKFLNLNPGLMKTEILYFTKRERKGVFLLFSLLVFFWFLPYTFPLFLTNEDFSAEAELERFPENRQVAVSGDQPEAAPFFLDPNSASRDTLVKWGVPVKLAQTWVNFRIKAGPFQQKEDLRKLYGMDEQLYRKLEPWLVVSVEEQTKKSEIEKTQQAVLFPFDPNHLSEDSLLLLGFSGRLAHTLENYRKKGGRFRKKEDLLSIYGLKEELYLRLEPYIRIYETEELSEVRAVWVSSEPAPDKTPGGDMPAEKENPRIDINRASPEEWQQLRGIGPYFAGRIVRFREALGGFLSIEQVAETYRLPDSTFQAIKPFLEWSPIPEKIPINRVDPERLAAHPYLNRRQAKAVVSYREQHGPFDSLGVVKKIKALSAEEWDRILPYLSLE